MTAFDLLAILIGISAIFSYLNHRFLKLPMAIGLMLIGILFSFALIGLGTIWPGMIDIARELLSQVEFDETLMRGMLGLLLFAGALHVDLNDLREQRALILILAVLGTFVSTLIVGFAIYYILPLLGLQIGLWYALLFGALISPTDPIAVLGILRKLGVSQRLETQITGESLFNDGVGVVVFLTVWSLAGLGGGHGEMNGGDIAVLFGQEVLGGGLFGLMLGLIGYWTLKSIDNYQVEILISLALVVTGYGIAVWLHISGPIAMVVAGLLLGNQGRSLAMSDTTRLHLDLFWELVDEFLNAILFVLIGLEVLVLTFAGNYILAGVLAIVVVLLARFIAVSLPVTLLRRTSTIELPRYTTRLMTWGGLRGGISVALALSIPIVVNGEPFETRQLILTMTYLIVSFSILVQGLTMGPLLRRWNATSPADVDTSSH